MFENKMVILYSLDCPKCLEMEHLLAKKGVKYVKCDDIQTMVEKKIQDIPQLEVDGNLFDFETANRMLRTGLSPDIT